MARPEITGQKISTKESRQIDRIAGPPSAESGLARPEVTRRKVSSESAERDPHRIRGPPAVHDADAYSVAEFCRRHRFSPQAFYKFRGEMPLTFRVGSRVLISREAAARWRAEREHLSAQNGG